MKLSIIIPTLNESERIESAVARAGRLQPHELIVVDGGSRDGTWEQLDGQDCLRLECEADRARQQNLGAASATGDWLLFLHADTWLEPAAAEQLESASADNSLLGGAFRQHIESSAWIYRYLEWGNSARARWLGTPYGDQGIFLRRTVFEQLGGFPDVAIMEDLILMRRLRKRGRPRLLPGPIHVDPRRWQRSGVLRQTLYNWRLTTGYLLGESPDKLARRYPPHR